ncbi:hypothetical protein [Oceanobacillus timonensis]|uniref:hypothetical protein n=1 Tax=Oceanobacillus timonensis TaxID=1926285 RepID=UPI0009BC1D07|nr:hypothetical protein [Oceanobacillus timonensis]
MNTLENIIFPIILGLIILSCLVSYLSYKFYLSKASKNFKREINVELDKEQPDFQKIITNIIDFQKKNKKYPYFVSQVVNSVKESAFSRLHKIVSMELNKEQPDLQKNTSLLHELERLTYDEVSRMYYRDLKEELGKIYQKQKMVGIEKVLTGKLGHSDFMLNKVDNKENWYQLEAKDGNYLALFSIEGIPPNIKLVKFFKTNKDIN